MNRLILLLSFFMVLCSCGFSQPQSTQPITPGAYNLPAYLPLLKGKKVALVVNQTSEIGGTHLVDTLLSLGIDVKKVFAPEHGFRGQAADGELVKDGMDTKTNTPITSLYGSHRKPTNEDLKGLDIIIFDIQDVGTRFYTYISTMHYVMDACAANQVDFMVLDRPNPNGMYIDGPVRTEKFKSFIAMDPIPVLHGLTVGELAMMINGEQWLESGMKCNLRVIPVKNYTHADNNSLPVKPSPNLPNDLAIELYPSLCFFEGTVVSVGRGTYEPFLQIGHPEFKDMPDQFTPKSIKGMSNEPPHEGATCYGINFTNKKDIEGGLHLNYLINFYNKYNHKDFFKPYFNTLAGTDQLQAQIKQGLSEKEIKQTWEEELKNYKKIRTKYLLYPDNE
ncbi:DUF1343 domain-containing protein [Fulvivirga maritima]|uniref:exo-beta-N-acetylmuramidase NamZ family protein n=1 Tax=Fulvivirga maritima TaxID=2904247 RepID=UPI001F165E81|nr:DUF1343 domain-containing protein [Fulvivirga maritima]UII24461.1 DUF1343 domain-containing protein [Fulvivirga maritima]